MHDQIQKCIIRDHENLKGLCNNRYIKSFWVVSRRYNSRKWEDNIKMDRQEVGCGGLDWIEQARDRDRWRALVNVVINLLVP